MAIDGSRFRMRRAGVLNVWQYDEQVFDFADGRLLLRGANGAGKSKTMEMLLPFVIDGDKARLTSSGRHHTSLLWLLLDGYEGSARTGYVWVEFGRDNADGTTDVITCGVGLRATEKARAATSWFFTTPRRVGHDLALENAAGPLSQPALSAALEDESGASRVFDNPRHYREHVGALLFGLPLDQYESLLRLLYWLRQPQVGEDIDPRRLAEQLVHALPTLDGDTVSAAGTTFDELEAYGEDIDRRERAAAALATFVETYAAYARSVVTDRTRVALEAATAVGTARRRLRRTEGSLTDVTEGLSAAAVAIDAAEQAQREAASRIAALEQSPEAQARTDLAQSAELVQTLEKAASDLRAVADKAHVRAQASAREASAATDRLMDRAGELHDASKRAEAALAACGAEVPPGPTAAQVLRRPDWGDADAARAVESAVAHAGHTHAEWAETGTRAAGQVGAAITVVEEARSTHARAQETTRRAEAGVDRAEAAETAALAELETARARTQARERELTEALQTWQGAPGAVAVVLPTLDADGLAHLESIVAEAAAPDQERLATQVAEARARHTQIVAGLVRLTSERATIEAEQDPAPAAPAWLRDDRRDLPGAPLWRLVDFRPEVDGPVRAAVEAALEGSGLLDAWVTPDGTLLDPTCHDVVLTADPVPVAADASLLNILGADPSAHEAVPARVVTDLLGSIAFASAGAGQHGARDEVAAVVAADGSWRLGPAQGRTAKSVAQYVGASARAQERARRLAELDERIRQEEQARDTAKQAAAAAQQALTALMAWLRARPRHDAVLTAWATEAARTAVAERASAEAMGARDLARDARSQEAAALSDLTATAARHGLPITHEGLAARRELVATAGKDLDRVRSARRALDTALDVWRGVVARATDDAAEADLGGTRARIAGSEAASRRAAHNELVAARGKSVEDLERRLAEQRTLRQEAVEAQRRHRGEHDHLLVRQGQLRQEADGHRAALAGAEPARDAAYDAVRALHAVPGLISAADVGADPARPPTERDEIISLHERAAAGTQAGANAVLAALTGLQTGPASIVEPRLAELDGTFAALGRDESAGDIALSELANRLAAQVAADRELLTDRERHLFETHVLGQLGDTLRGVRRQADELVAAMNVQLGRVSTSQGIRVRLRWRLRDDIPSDARRAVQLLGEASGALLPGERTELRDALHRLIDTSRVEAPEESYTEHLTRALDYRQWFAFTVQYQRTESGDWRDLHRKSPLSQGEQKVLCYLPLFAAAAAHFTSLAGAAPHAPRFVLLDDAFPKVDARTHPLLFGLLVDLDLDFVVTSERLWGTHATVPSLAIYEALRNPAERGIAQYEHRWDGRQLTAVGARA